MFHYRLYGLTVQSDRAIADLAPHKADTTDITLTFGQAHWCAPRTPEAVWRTSPRQQLTVWHWPAAQAFCWRYRDGCTFWLTQNPTQVSILWPDDLTPEDAITYLLGPVLAFILRLRGYVCLHASAVAFPQGAALFVGPGGAGKSTTAAILAQSGCTVLTDDVVVLQAQGDRFEVSPGYPRLRLWPASTELLYRDIQALPRLVPTHPTWHKQYLDLRQGHYAFAHQAVPLRRVYCLGARSRQAPSYCGVPITAQAALLQLTANTSVNYLLDRPMRQQEFVVLGHLLQCIPCDRLHVTENSQHFSALSKLLQEAVSNV